MDTTRRPFLPNNTDKPMPILNVKLVRNAFDAKQKQELISKLTDAVESVYPGLRDVTFVTIEEVNEADWGIGGKLLTANDVADHARQAKSS